MSEVGRVNKHKTTHQDGGDDELVLTGILPGVHKTTHQDGGDDEIDATGLTGTGRFVDRGDPVTWDFTLSNFITDGNWNDLDLSAIVPAGAIAVALHVQLNDDTLATKILIAKKGLINFVNLAICRIIVAAVTEDLDIITFLDSNRKLTYNATNTTWTALSVVVKGWWI